MSSCRMTRARKARQLGANSSSGATRTSVSSFPRHMGRGATPAITAWCLDQPRTHRVQFNIPRGGEQIWLVEHE